jgi:hypothetical protein
MAGNRKILLVLLLFCAPATLWAQEANSVNNEFGPNVQVYLDYLKQELTVTDLRESQREVSAIYVRHNYNRVSALRQFAIKFARESEIDFIPELEAVTQKEFHTLFFDKPPKVKDLRVGEIYNLSYRYLGIVRNAEVFYIFARLDPYEEEEVRKQDALQNAKKDKPDDAQARQRIVTEEKPKKEQEE